MVNLPADQPNEITNAPRLRDGRNCRFVEVDTRAGISRQVTRYRRIHQAAIYPHDHLGRPAPAQPHAPKRVEHRNLSGSENRFSAADSEVQRSRDRDLYKIVTLDLRSDERDFRTVFE